MKKRELLLIGLLSISNFGFSQLDSFEVTLDPMFSIPEQDGWMYFSTPNNYQPGACFQFYKTQRNDTKNDMLLLGVHQDSLANYIHYKFQQLYKGVPIEGAGCIEHFDPNGSLVFTNAKHAIDIEENVVPAFNTQQIIDILISQLPNNSHFAWNHPHWEQQIKEDKNDSTATWFPTPKLMLAVEEVRDMHGDIDGNRYNLVYEISITTITPDAKTILYYIDAHDGSIFKTRSGGIDNVNADVYGYGNRLIDAEWFGGFVQKFYLKASDGNHNIHTKKYNNGSSTWNNWPDTKKDGPNWGNTYLTETSAHYHVTNTWDFFYSTFGRVGFDNQGTEIKVATQIPENNAYFNHPILPDGLMFGYTTSSHSYGDEPSVVAHEYAHGITKNTANLTYEFESGALNESFSDILGVSVHALVLDGGATDWIYGNFIPSSLEETRSFINPNTRGSHWTGIYDNNNYPIYSLGQPKSYNGNYYCSSCPLSVDNGGVHINSGIQNKWFHFLAAGDQNLNITGVGITKSVRISYYALTSLLGSSAQFYDSKNATIQAAVILYGECSQEHISTIKAWNAVNITASNPCTTMSVDETTYSDDIKIYPNPTSSELNIEVSVNIDEEVKIYDLNGKVVRVLNVSGTYFSTSISELEKGAYFIHFHIDGHSIIKRLIIN